MMNPPKIRTKALHPMMLAFCVGFSFLIYFPVLNRYFVSDDFKILYRVCIENKVFIKGFFRPLSDLTIRWNYMLDGLNPTIFNSFNILIHGMNGYLIYRIMFSFSGSDNLTNQIQNGIIAAILFMCYPFHNEGVVWLLGRGASMACLFALFAILMVYQEWPEKIKLSLACLCFFISLAAFETTVILPLILFLFLKTEKKPRYVIYQWMAALMVTLCLHLIVRIYSSGILFVGYEKNFLQNRWYAYSLNVFKVCARLILPPMESSLQFSILFLGILSVLLIFLFRNFPLILKNKSTPKLTCLLMMLGISAVIPMIVSVSTKTSESDRVLYFPSAFLCMAGAFSLVHFFKNARTRFLLFCCVVFYHLSWLQANNKNWLQASSITFSVMQKISGNNDSGKKFFINIPNEINGAFVFRQGFTDVLRIYKKDTNRFVVLNYLPRTDLVKMQGEIKPKPENSVITIAPEIIIKKNTVGGWEIFNSEGYKTSVGPGDRIYFWNMERIDSLPFLPDLTGG